MLNDHSVLRAAHHLSTGGSLTVQVGPVAVRESLPNRLSVEIDGNVKVTCYARNVRDLESALRALAQLRRALDVETLALVRVPASAPCEAIGAQSQVGRRRLRRRRYH